MSEPLLRRVADSAGWNPLRRACRGDEFHVARRYPYGESMHTICWSTARRTSASTRPRAGSAGDSGSGQGDGDPALRFPRRDLAEAATSAAQERPGVAARIRLRTWGCIPVAPSHGPERGCGDQRHAHCLTYDIHMVSIRLTSHPKGPRNDPTNQGFPTNKM